MQVLELTGGAQIADQVVFHGSTNEWVLLLSVRTEAKVISMDLYETAISPMY